MNTYSSEVDRRQYERRQRVRKSVTYDWQYTFMIMHHYIIGWEAEPYVHWLPPPHRMRYAASV